MARPPADEAAWLGPLAAVAPPTGVAPTDGDLDRAWAGSGAMALTGPGATALRAPTPLVRRLVALGDAVAAAAAAAGRPVTVDPLALVVERAVLAGHRRRGAVSCGGHTRLLPTADTWVAVALARPDDVAAVPALLGLLGAVGSGTADPWHALAGALTSTRGVEAVEAGRLLGVPVAALGEVRRGPPPLLATPVGADDGGSRGAEGALVVDLSSLWAGPLCSRLLVAAGARVVKVESRKRPDGARIGVPGFFERLHAGKESVVLDLGSDTGLDALARLLHRADVVIEGSRPRALAQWGIDPGDILRRGRARAWVSLTGYGREGPGADRVAFGDDAAVAGGLVAWHAGHPCFVADAIADPLSGMLAAAAAMAALASGGRWLLDVALARTAARVAGADGHEQAWTGGRLAAAVGGPARGAS